MTKVLTRDDVLVLMRELIAREGTQGKAAAKIGVSSAYFGDVLKGLREPGPSIFEYFGLERETIYRQKKK